MKKTFREHVTAVVSCIPEGRVLTYGEVARRAGNARAYRAVGNIMKRNHNPHILCHRVICADGSVGGYNGGVRKKINKLRSEGVQIRNYKVIMKI